MLAIDRAKNNTSLVVELTWRRRQLLFSGDAEALGWQFMGKKAMLKSVNLLNIPHRGSDDSAIPENVLKRLLSLKRRNIARAILSTCEIDPHSNQQPYGGVPDAPTVDRIASRTREVLSTTSVPEGAFVKVELDPAD